MIGRFDIDKAQLIDNALKYLQPEKVMTVAEQLKQEGMEQKTKIIARNALKEGIEISSVAKITGLSLEQVQALKAKNDTQ